MGGNTCEANFPLSLQFSQSIGGAVPAKDLIFVIRIHLMGKIDVRCGSQVLSRFKNSLIHLIAGIEPGFIRDDDLIAADFFRKCSQFQFGVSIFRDNGRIVQIASESPGVLHDGDSPFCIRAVVAWKNRDIAA